MTTKDFTQLFPEILNPAVCVDLVDLIWMI